MSFLRRLAAAALLAATAASPAAAQSHPLIGKWDIEYPRGIRNENGEITTEMGKATLEIVQQGDSLIGTLTMTDVPGRPPGRLAGTGSAAAATLISKGQVRSVVNGDEHTMPVTVTWALTANGDVLTGTMSREVQGMDLATEPGPVKGTRMK